MIRKAGIAILSFLSALLVLFALMMWTSESIWSCGDVYDQGTKIRVSFADGGALIEYDGPLRAWWPRAKYSCELAWVEFHRAYVGSSIRPPDLELKSCAVATLQPFSAILFVNAGFVAGLYPLIAFARGPWRRWRSVKANEKVRAGDGQP